MKNIEWMSPIIAALILYIVFKINNYYYNKPDFLPVQKKVIGVLVFFGIINCILILAGIFFFQS